MHVDDRNRETANFFSLASRDGSIFGKEKAFQMLMRPGLMVTTQKDFETLCAFMERHGEIVSTSQWMKIQSEFEQKSQSSDFHSMVASYIQETIIPSRDRKS